VGSWSRRPRARAPGLPTRATVPARRSLRPTSRHRSRQTSRPFSSRANRR